MTQEKTPLFPNKRWLVCKPQDYDVRYSINPWMDVKVTPEIELARRQWQDLHHHLIRLGAWIEYVPHADGLPDMVFTANAGLVRQNRVVLSSFRYKERQGEEAFYQAWFEANGFAVERVTKGAYEGEGDALFCGDTLYCGWGFRSDKVAHEEVGGIFNVKDLVLLELRDDRFYHLDTCFCPLTPELGMVYRGAFTEEGIATLERSMELIFVSEADAIQFVCNAVVLGSDIILPAGCEDTYSVLKKFGFRTYPVALSEFIKAGGAAKCLSLKLDN
jgi:N-dimethylarginine dimethylaminohydrolase